MQRFIALYCRLLEYLMAACLALMVVLVFGNVVLRYGFNSGIPISEELSRWLFVWVTFMGAVVALRERAHLGTDMLVGRLGLNGKKVCLALTYLVMLAICTVIFKGAWEQTRINWTSTSAAMQVSMGYFFVVGLMFAVLGGLVLMVDLFRLLTGQMSETEISGLRQSEELAHGVARP